MYDVARSLIHHGFNKIVFINGHGSNVKVVDPVLRKIRYDTGALVGFCKPFMERYVGLLEGLMENPADETPGWHASELETSQMLAQRREPGPDGSRREDADPHPAVAAGEVRQEGRRAGHPVRGLQLLPVPDGPPRVHRDAASSATPSARPQEKGEEAFRRYAEHVARAVGACWPSR